MNEIAFFRLSLEDCENKITGLRKISRNLWWKRYFEVDHE